LPGAPGRGKVRKGFLGEKKPQTLPSFLSSCCFSEDASRGNFAKARDQCPIEALDGRIVGLEIGDAGDPGAGAVAELGEGDSFRDFVTSVGVDTMGKVGPAASPGAV